METRRIRIVTTVLVLAAAALGACQAATEVPTPEAPPQGMPLPEAPAPPPAAPEEQKVAVFIFTQEFDTLNPYYSNMFFSIVTDQLWNV